MRATHITAALLLFLTLPPHSADAQQPIELTFKDGRVWLASRGATLRQIPAFGQISTQLGALTNQATYQPLLDTANTLAASLPTGRVVITLPDGTVVLDTARDDNTADPKSNSYQHFLDKTINENHNSRLAILGAQEYACGVGLESKLSTTTGLTESYVAIRVGEQLNSLGTVRMSIVQ